jgi:hypothetical protein
MRVLPVIFNGLGLAVVCNRVEHRPLEQPERPAISTAKSPTGLNDLIKDRLQPYGPGNCAKNSANRELLPAQILELTSHVRAIGGQASHSSSLV